MTIFSALTRQWELQLALKSPMAVATPLSLKKQPYQCAYAWKKQTCKPALPAKQNRQFDWQFTKPWPDSPAEVTSSTCHQLANTSGSFPATWALRSELAIDNGGLLITPCILRIKLPPPGKYLKTTPSGEIVCKTTPDGEICLMWTILLWTTFINP